jgi:hypothetical protein
MNHSLLLAQSLPSSWGTVALGIVGIVVVVFIFLMIWASRYIKVGPNEVLVVSGRKHRYTDPDGTRQFRGFRVVKGGGTFVIPVIEKVDKLSLELLTIDVEQQQDVYTSKGVPVRVDGVAQIKVKGDDISISTAAEQFLSKATEDIKHIANQTLEGHLRAILGTMTVEDIYQNRDAFAAKVQEVAAGDMANMGLSIVSFTIKDIRQPRLPRRAGQAADCAGETRRTNRPGGSGPGCDDQVLSGPTGRAGSQVRGRLQNCGGATGLPVECRAIPGRGKPEESRGRPCLRFAEVQDRPARKGRGSAGADYREAEADRVTTAGNHAQAKGTGSERAEAG